MAHDHSAHHHEDAHGHSHTHEITNVNTAFIIGIALNSLFVITELVFGFSTSSLALISDAGHNATDVLSLLLSLFAFKMMKVKASEKYSYGYKKVSILVSLVNAVFLIGTTFIIFYEGIRRINEPVAIQGKLISIIALAGVLINVISAWLFFRGKEKDINVRSAYLHLLSDALVAFGVVITGIIIYFTNWFWLDTAISFVIGIIILVATWNLLNESIRLNLDGVPRNIEMEKVKAIILKFPQIANVHHIHIWPLSSSENAMTAHLVLKENDLEKFEGIKQQLKHELEHYNIHHTTFEVEANACKDDSCALNMS